VISVHWKILLVAVLMAFGVTTRVGADKNAERELRYDFAVIGDGQQPLAMTELEFTAAPPLPQSVSVKASRYALAAWGFPARQTCAHPKAGGWLAAVS
jgi:hypothetical protein